MSGPKTNAVARPGSLDSYFGLTARGTTCAREVFGGLVTFMTMAYIIFVNPVILAAAGMPKEAVVAATCLGAAVPSLLMGLYANYPLALASGMGLNAAVVAAASQPDVTWQTMMGVIVLEGLLVTLLVLTGIREQVMRAIPMNLKRAIGVGIGILIAFLGLQQTGWIAQGEAGAFLIRGNFLAKPTVVATLGVLLVMVLMTFKVRGALLLGILGTVATAGLADLLTPTAAKMLSLPSQLVALPDFSAFAEADILSALKPALIGVVFAFLITDFFDTMGTVIAIGGQAGFLDARGNLPGLKRVLLVDSVGAVWGGVCGASSVTTYIESAAGVGEGARTGLASVVVAALFAVSIFLSPLVTAVPAAATAPALLVVGFLMMATVREMDLATPDEGMPAFLTLLLIPLSQSISCGIGVGFISLVAVKVLSGRGRDVSPWLYAIALLFAMSFLWRDA